MRRHQRLHQPLAPGAGSASSPGLLVEVRQAWIRTRSHTVVFDRDPEFEHFCDDTTGDVHRLLRVWLCDGPVPQTYLGAVSATCNAGSFRADVRRALRRAAPDAHSRRYRHTVLDALRSIQDRANAGR